PPAAPPAAPVPLHDALPISLTARSHPIAPAKAFPALSAHTGKIWTRKTSRTAAMPYQERPTNAQLENPDGSPPRRATGGFRTIEDRKSTRLNSSHVKISYAV